MAYLEIRNYSKVEDDTEVIALMPDIDSAVAWIRAQLDLEIYLEGDYYCVDPTTGLRTYLTSEGEGRYFITIEEGHVIGRLVAAVIEEQRVGSTATHYALDLQDRFGWGRAKST